MHTLDDVLWTAFGNSIWQDSFITNLRQRCEHEKVFKDCLWEKLNLCLAFVQPFKYYNIKPSLYIQRDQIQIVVRDYKHFTGFIDINRDSVEIFFMTINSTYSLATTNYDLVLRAIYFALREKDHNNETCGGNPHTLH